MAQRGQKKREVLFTIESVEHFQEKLEPENNQKLLCVDAHLAWCGRCDTMEQNYRNLFMRFDEDFVKMEFFSAAQENIPEDILSSLQHGPLTCKPRFLIYFNGQKKDEISGANYTQLEASVQQHIPQFDD